MQQLKRENKPWKHLMHRLNGEKTRYDENELVTYTPPLFWDVRQSEEENVPSVSERPQLFQPVGGY
jgi:hypothetical protein